MLSRRMDVTNRLVIIGLKVVQSLSE